MPMVQMMMSWPLNALFSAVVVYSARITLIDESKVAFEEGRVSVKTVKLDECLRSSARMRRPMLPEP